jgi:hypothetical protein
MMDLSWEALGLISSLLYSILLKLPSSHFQPRRQDFVVPEVSL